jgi:hypothetical protein
MQCHDRMLAINGLTPDVVKKIDNSPALEPGEKEEKQQDHINMQRRLQRLSSQFLDYLEKDCSPWTPQSSQKSELVEV